MTQAEYEATKEALRQLDTRKLADFIVSLTHRSLVLSKEWERHIKDAVRFYDVAQKRDGTIDQHIKAFSESKEEAAVLVFGGFHANAIKDILRQQGFSYVVISPKITAIDKRHQDYYKHLMTDGHHAFEIPFLAARANRAPGYPYLAATGKAAFVRSELRAIAASVEGSFDPQLIERRMADFKQAQKIKVVNTATGTSQLRSETRERYWEEMDRVNTLWAPEQIAKAGKYAFSKFGSGIVAHGVSLVAFLYDHPEIQKIMAPVIEGLKKTEAFRNGKIHLIEHYHHTFYNWINNRPASESERVGRIFSEKKQRLTNSSAMFSSLELQVDGIDVNRKNGKIFLDLGVPSDEYMRFWESVNAGDGQWGRPDRLSVAFAVVTKELTREEKEELKQWLTNWKVFEGKPDVMINSVSLVHHLDNEQNKLSQRADFTLHSLRSEMRDPWIPAQIESMVYRGFAFGGAWGFLNDKKFRRMSVLRRADPRREIRSETRVVLEKSAEMDLSEYVDDFLKDPLHESFYLQNQGELLETLLDSSRISFALKPRPRLQGQDKSEWAEKIFHPYSRYQNDFLNGLNTKYPEIIQRLFTPKLLSGPREPAIRQFLQRLNKGQPFFQALDWDKNLESQGVIVRAVTDKSSGRGLDEGAMVFRITLQHQGHECSFYFKGFGVGPKGRAPGKKPEGAETFEVFVYEFLKLVGRNSTESAYYAIPDPLTGKEVAEGFTLMAEIPAEDANILFNIQNGLFQLKPEYEIYRNQLIQEFARAAAQSDLLRMGDRPIAQSGYPQYPANYMVDTAALGTERDAVYNIDAGWLFNSSLGPLLWDIRKNGNPEISIVMSVENFSTCSFRADWYSQYKQAYLDEWRYLLTRKAEIEALVAQMYGKDSEVHKRFLAFLQSDPDEQVENQKNALLDFISMKNKKAFDALLSRLLIANYYVRDHEKTDDPPYLFSSTARLHERRYALEDVADFVEVHEEYATEEYLGRVLIPAGVINSEDDAVHKVLSAFFKANKAAFSEQNFKKMLEMLADDEWGVRQAVLMSIPYFLKANNALATKDNLGKVQRFLINQNQDIASEAQNAVSAFITIAPDLLASLPESIAKQLRFPRSELRENQIVVTGASGDLGAVLTRYIDAKGDSVDAIVRSEDGKQKYKDRAVRDLSDKQFVLSDLFDRRKMQAVVARSTVFYHLAALVGLDKDTDTYPENFKVNGLAAIGLIKMAEEINPNLRFIFASTQRVYGIEKDPRVNHWIEHALQVIDENTGLFKEGDYSQSMDQLMSLILEESPFPEGVYPYELAKLLVERYLARNILKGAISVRISSLYGPGNLSGRKIQRMIEARLKGQTIEEKREIRDYLYGQDAIEILYRLGVLKHISKHHVVDLASGVETSAEEIWDYIVKHTPEAKGRVAWKGDPIPANPQSNKLGRKLLRRDFTHIETGIRNQIDEARWRLSPETSSTNGEGPVLVIDAGGTSTRMGVWDGEKLTDQIKFPTVNYDSPDARGKSIEQMQEIWLESLAQKIREYRARYPHMQSISMGFAGPVGEDGDLAESAVIWGPDRHKISNAALQKKWGLPVKVVNDLTAAVYRYGRSKKFSGMRTIALITVSSGIGSKLFDVVHGNVVIDRQGRAGEIGHTVVDYAGNAIPGEGLKGELNAYASGRGLSNLAKRLARQKKFKVLYERSALKTEIEKTSQTIETIDRDLLTRLLVDAIKEKDDFSMKVMKISITYLVRILGPFILQNAPDAIVWMGSIAEHLEPVYLDEVIDQLLSKGLYGYTRDDLKKMFVMGEKDDENGLRGAGLMAFDKHGNATEQVVHNPGYVRDSVDPRGHEMIEAVAPNDLQQRNYFTEGAFDVGNPILADVLEKRNVIFVVEKAVADKVLEPLKQYIRHYHLEKNVKGEIQVLDGGEKIKSEEQVRNLTDYAQDQKLDRNGIFVVVGGGAVMDMVGMVANQFRRGVRYVRIPTTLLGQVDAAVGVKVGIDYRTAKNFLGAFYPPFATITDTRFLETLPERQIQGGIAEIIKVALISNPSLFEILEKYRADFIRDMPKAEERTFIKDAAVELLKHLQMDFFEHNLMRHVDFGHVLAHKFESMTNYELSHGEAVAIDMLMSAHIARDRGLLNEADFQRILSLHKKLKLPFYHPALNPDRAWDGLQESKAHKGGRLMMVVPIGIGRTTFIDSLRRDELDGALDFLRRHQEQSDEELMIREINGDHPPVELMHLHQYLESLPSDPTYHLTEISDVLKDLLGSSIQMIINVATNQNLDPGTRAKASEMLAKYGLHTNHDWKAISLHSLASPNLKNIKFRRYGEAFVPDLPVKIQTDEAVAHQLLDKEAFVFDIDGTLISEKLDPEIVELIIGLLKRNKTVAFATVRGLTLEDYYAHIRKGEGLGILKNIFEHPDFKPEMLSRIFAYTGVTSYKYAFRMKPGRTRSGWFNIEPVLDKKYSAKYLQTKTFSEAEAARLKEIKTAILETENSFSEEYGFPNPDQDYEGFVRSAKIQEDEKAILYFPRTKQGDIETWKLRIMLQRLKTKLAEKLPSQFFGDLSLRVTLRKGIAVVKKHNRKDEAVLDLESMGHARQKICFFADGFSSDGVDRTMVELPGLTVVSVLAPIPGNVQMLQLKSEISEKGPDRVKRILKAYLVMSNARSGRSEMRESEEEMQRAMERVAIDGMALDQWVNEGSVNANEVIKSLLDKVCPVGTGPKVSPLIMRSLISNLNKAITQVTDQQLRDRIQFLSLEYEVSVPGMMSFEKLRERVGFFNAYLRAFEGVYADKLEEITETLNAFRDDIWWLVRLAGSESVETGAKALKEVLESSAFKVAAGGERISIAEDIDFNLTPQSFWKSTLPTKITSWQDITDLLQRKEVFVFDVDNTLVNLHEEVEPPMIDFLIQLLGEGKTIALDTFGHFKHGDYPALESGKGIGLLKKLFEHPEFRPEFASRIFLYPLGSRYKFSFQINPIGKVEDREDGEYYERYGREREWSESESKYVQILLGAVYDLHQSWQETFKFASPITSFTEFKENKLHKWFSPILYAPNRMASINRDNSTPRWQLRIMLADLRRILRERLPPEYFKMLTLRSPNGRVLVVGKKGLEKNAAVSYLESAGHPRSDMVVFDDAFESDGDAWTFLKSAGLDVISVGEPVAGDFHLIQPPHEEGSLLAKKTERILRHYFQTYEAKGSRSESRTEFPGGENVSAVPEVVELISLLSSRYSPQEMQQFLSDRHSNDLYFIEDPSAHVFFYQNRYYLIYSNKKTGKRHLIGASSYAALKSRQIEAIALELGIYLKENKPKEIFVFPTKFCPIGCEHCIYGSPPPRGHSSKDILSSEDVAKTIRLINRFDRVDKLSIGGGGEPTLEGESVLRLVREANAAKIKILTAGNWGVSERKAEGFLLDLDHALAQRGSSVALELNISADEFHVSRITGGSGLYLRTILSVYERLKSRGLMQGVELHFRGVSKDGKIPASDDPTDPIQAILRSLRQNGRIISEVRDGSDAMWTLSGNIPVKVSYNRLSQKGDADAQAMWKRIMTARENPGIKSLLVNYDGIVSIGKYYSGIPLGHLSDIHEDDIASMVDNQMIFNALQNRGFKYLIDIAKEYDPAVEKKIFDPLALYDPHAMISKALSLLLQDPNRRLYIELKIIQSLKEEGRSIVSSLGSLMNYSANEYKVRVMEPPRVQPTGSPGVGSDFAPIVSLAEELQRLVLQHSPAIANSPKSSRSENRSSQEESVSRIPDVALPSRRSQVSSGDVRSEVRFNVAEVRTLLANWAIEEHRINLEGVQPISLEVFLREAESLGSVNPEWVLRSILGKTSREKLSAEEVELFFYQGKVRPVSILYLPNIRPGDIQHSNRLKKGVPVTSSNHPISPVVAESLAVDLISKMRSRIDLSEHARKGLYVLGKYTGSLVLGSLVANLLKLPFVTLTKRPYAFDLPANKTMVKIPEPHMPPENPEYFSYMTMPRGSRVLFIDDEITSGDVVTNTAQALKNELNTDMVGVGVALQSAPEARLRLDRIHLPYASLDQLSEGDLTDASQNSPRLVPFREAIPIVSLTETKKLKEPAKDIHVEFLKMQTGAFFADHPFRGMTLGLDPDLPDQTGEKISEELEEQLGALSALRKTYYEKGRTLFMVGATPSGILGALPTSRVTRLPLIGAMNRPEPKGYEQLNISDVVNYIGLDGYAYSMFGLTAGDGVLLVTGELTDGEEQIRIIKALKQKGVDVLGVVSLVENTRYQGRKRVKENTGLSVITLKKYEADEGVYRVNRTPAAFAAIKYAVMRLEEAVKKINPNASVKSVRVLHSSLTGGWMIPDSDIDEGYIWVDGISQFELSRFQKPFNAWLEAGGFRFEGLNNKAPILLSFWHQDINEKTYELERFPYVEIYRDGQFFDSHDLVNRGIMAFSKPAEKTMARIKWLFSANEMDKNYLRKLLQLVREKASWRPDQIQAFEDVINNLEKDRLSAEALECLEWLDQVYLTGSREMNIPEEKTMLFRKALPELLNKGMIRIYGDKILLVWRHGTAIWSDRFWTDQMRAPGHEKFLEEAQKEWYESLPESREIRENYEQVIGRTWEPGMSPLLAEYTMRSWIGRSTSLTDEEKKRWWESLKLTNAIVWGAAVEVAAGRETELKGFLSSTIHNLLNDPQTASKSQLYLYLSLNLMFRWMRQRTGPVDDDIRFILDELVKDSGRRKVPTMVLQDLTVRFASVYERIADPALREQVYKFVCNQKYSFKDRARRFGEKAFQMIAEKSPEDVARFSPHPTAQNVPDQDVPENIRDLERGKLFDEFERRRLSGRPVEFLISDWDSSLVSAKSGQENKLDSRMAVWLNWLLSKGKKVVISTAASYPRFYQQALDPSANRVPLQRSANLSVFNDTVAFLNDRPIPLRKFTTEFQARLEKIMQDRGWNFLDDGRPPQISFWRGGISRDEAVREVESLRGLLPRDEPVYLTLSKFRGSEWIIKYYYATKEHVYQVPLADGGKIQPERSVVMGDDGGPLGNDAPLFRGAPGAFKINLGVDSVDGALTLETKNEQASLLAVEAWAASILLWNPGEMFSWEGLAYQLEQDYRLERTEIDRIIAPVKKLVEDALAKQRAEEDLLLKDAVTKSHGMRESPVYFLELHPSNRCNLNCKDCIAGKRHKGSEFPFAQLDKVGALKPSELLVIGGGEPTLYRESGHDFNDFILKLAEVAPQADIGLGTNGVLVPPGDWIQKIKWVSISLHGVNREDFKQFTSQDKFDAVWNNIFNVYALQSLIKDIKVSFVYNGDNFHEILPLLEKIRLAWEDVDQKLKAKGVEKNFWFFLQAEATDEGPDKPFSIMSLSPEKKHEWAEAMNKLPVENPALWAFIKKHAPYIAAGPLRERQKEPAKMCWIVSNYLLLAATGKIYPCCLMPASAPENHLGDIAQPLEELLKNRQMLMWAPPKRCRLDCHIRGTLSGMTVKKQLLNPPADTSEESQHKRSEMRVDLPMERRSIFSIRPGATRDDLLKLATKVGADLTFGDGDLPAAGLVFKAGFKRMPLFENPDPTGFVRKKDTLWFSHFIDNAIDAIADRADQSGVTVSGQISLKLSREGTNTVLELSDNGIGFSKIALDKVNPNERFTTKPEREKNLRIGGYGAALSTIPNVVSDRRGIVEIETRTMDGASWKRTVDYKNGLQNTWAIPSQPWNRSEQGTTIRWTIPDPIQDKGTEGSLSSESQLKIGASSKVRAVIEQAVEEELAQTRERYVQKNLSDPEIQDLAKTLGLSDVVLRERLESIRRLPEKRDEHIHLGGAISTPGIRRIARWINNQELTKAERDKFWDLMWRIPNKDGTLVKRFNDVETSERMREIVLDERGEDLDFKTLSQYVEHNGGRPSLEGKNGLENFLDRSYTMGSILLNTSVVPERFLKRIAYLILEDVAMAAVQDNVKTIDLRIKGGRTLNQLEAQNLHFLSQSAREVEALLLQRGYQIKINFVFSFNREVDTRVKNIIVKMDIAIQNFVDRLFQKLHMFFGWGWLQGVHFNWLNGYSRRAVEAYINKELLDLLKDFPREELEKIIGIDLTGDEWVGAKSMARNIPYINYFLAQLESIKKHKGVLSETVAYAHAGEDFETASEGIKMMQVIADGIAKGKLKGLIHGAALAYVSPEAKEFKDITETMVRKGIPLFISLSTNRETGVLDHLTRFPMEDLENAGITLIPSTDDPRCSKTTLSIEKLKIQLLRERSALLLQAKIRQEPDVLVAKKEPNDSAQERRSEIRQTKAAMISDVAVISMAKAQAERMVQSIRKNALPATVFVDAEDFPSFSSAQKQEYLLVALSRSETRIIVYNERGQVRDRELAALLKLDHVERTDRDLGQAVGTFSRSNVPAIHLSKHVLPSQTLVGSLRKKVAFFKANGNKSGTLATALLWAISGGETVHFSGVKEENGFWTVEESLLDALQRTYDNNFVIAVAA